MRLRVTGALMRLLSYYHISQQKFVSTNNAADINAFVSTNNVVDINTLISANNVEDISG